MGLGRAGLRYDSKKIEGLICKMARAGRACALAAPSHMERPRRQEGRPKRGGARDVELSLRNPMRLVPGTPRVSHLSNADPSLLLQVSLGCLLPLQRTSTMPPMQICT